FSSKPPARPLVSRSTAILVQSHHGVDDARRRGKVGVPFRRADHLPAAFAAAARLAGLPGARLGLLAAWQPLTKKPATNGAGQRKPITWCRKVIGGDSALIARRRQPRELGGVRTFCHFVFGGGKRNRAMDAIRFHGKGRLRVKLIGQHPLDQLSSLPAALRLGPQGRHLHAAFLPIEMKPGLATFCQGLLSPPDGEVPSRLLECAVFDRIGHEFVQGHREGLNCAGAQRNALRSVERYLCIFQGFPTLVLRSSAKLAWQEPRPMSRTEHDRLTTIERIERALVVLAY